MVDLAVFPLSLYIHLPWCVRKCPYCDFNSHTTPEKLAEKEYVSALAADLEQDLQHVQSRSISSIFIGGGTPSLFSAEAIDNLLTRIHTLVDIDTNAEVTLEANPGAVEQGKFSEFKSIGINRLSIGVQSFNNDHLGRLGRIHNRNDAIKAVESTHNAGFDNFNLDLMYGLPTQNAENAVSDINIAIDMEPTHISHYQLTIEPNTLFHHSPPSLPDEDMLCQMMTACQSQLHNREYAHYETSAYARNKFECNHNLNYWTFGDYLGIGAGAHAKVTDTNTYKVTRTWKLKNPRDYVEHASASGRIGDTKILASSELPLEFMMNALRLTQGIKASLFHERTGLPLSGIQASLDQAVELELLNLSDEMIRPTDKGQRFLNDLLQLFMET